MSEPEQEWGVAASYPVRLDLEAPLEVARWRPLVHWLLVIPHLILLWLLTVAAGIAVIVAWFVILFTGGLPQGLFGFLVMVNRYSWRVQSYMLWMREPYPAFEFASVAEDPGGDPAWLSVDYPDRLSRLLIFVKWLLALPHYVVLWILGIVALLAMVVSWFAVLITGRYPAGLRDFVVGVTRWNIRVNAYVTLLTDQYPPFTLR